MPGRHTPKSDPAYTHLTIEAMLPLRLVFRQALRQAEEFANSILTIMELDLPIPDDSTLPGARPEPQAIAWATIDQG